MKAKIIGAAVAAALLGLSSVAVAQGAGGNAAGSSAASGQDTPREASRADSGAGSAAGASGGVVTSGSGNVVTTPAPATGMVSRCDNLTGAEKTRCMRDERPSSGSSTTPGVPVTPKPGDSGAGAIDKTRPGAEPAGANQSHPRDVGTSSAGSGGGK